MSTVDLFLLGMLAENPCSAYDIQKAIGYRNLSHWIKVGKATVFKNMRALEAKGYVAGEEQKQGNMPAKTVYTITASGRAAFGAMMREIAQQPVGLLFDFNAMVANLNKVPPTEAHALIMSLKENMETQKAYIESMQPQREGIPIVGRTIMQQQVMVYTALLQWLDAFTQELEQEGENQHGKAK